MNGGKQGPHDRKLQQTQNLKLHSFRVEKMQKKKTPVRARKMQKTLVSSEEDAKNTRFE